MNCQSLDHTMTDKELLEQLPGGYTTLRFGFVAICGGASEPGAICRAMILETVRALGGCQSWVKTSERSLYRLMQRSFSPSYIHKGVKALVEEGLLKTMEGDHKNQTLYKLNPKNIVRKCDEIAPEVLTEESPAAHPESKKAPEVLTQEAEVLTQEAHKGSNNIYMPSEPSTVVVLTTEGLPFDPHGSKASLEEKTPLTPKSTMTQEQSEIVNQILTAYYRAPDKLKDKRFKGSIAKLTRDFGDRLISVVQNLGSDAVQAMENFVKDEYWSRNGLPINAFLKQAQEFVSTEKPQHTTSRPKYERKPDPTPIPVPMIPATETARPAIHRKREALDILQMADSALFEDARRLLGVKSDLIPRDVIEHWHGVAVEEFKKKHGRMPPVVTKPC